MTKIIVTIGPNSESPEDAREIIKQGANSFRFPASKFPAAALAEQAEMVAGLARDAGVELDLLLDLPGSKSRLTNPGGFLLAGIDRLKVNYAPVPANRDAELPEIGISGLDLSGVIDVGDILVLGDGEDALQVERTADDHCITVPLTGSELGRRRGVTVQGKRQGNESLTQTDLDDLAMAAASVFTGVIISFVEDAETVRRARAVMADRSANPPVLIAKIETRTGAETAKEIAEAADAVLLGRGDLLLDCGEIDFYELCKDVIKATQKLGKPIIVGTQLLPSMSGSWLPNRSELAYVSHLIEKGVDGLMLSFETTIGRQPVRTTGLLKSLVARYGADEEGPIFPARHQPQSKEGK
jgi:pyruvate kinase